MQTKFDLDAAVTIPRRDEAGTVTHRLPAVVTGIAVNAMVGERYRVEFADEQGYKQSLEFAADDVEAA